VWSGWSLCSVRSFAPTLVPYCSLLSLQHFLNLLLSFCMGCGTNCERTFVEEQNFSIGILLCCKRAFFFIGACILSANLWLHCVSIF